MKMEMIVVVRICLIFINVIFSFLIKYDIDKILCVCNYVYMYKYNYRLVI